MTNLFFYNIVYSIIDSPMILYITLNEFEIDFDFGLTAI